MKTDLELRQDVERELAWNPKLNAGNISVTVSNTAVTLAGQVGNYASKWEVENRVKHVAGVTAIANDLTVVPEGGQPSDAALTQSVLHALAANVFIPSGITAAVQNGWVTLRGSVLYYYEKQDAMAAVRPLRGIRGMTDALAIVNPVEPQDVSEEIADALERNARIDPQNIVVKVSGRAVVLEGSVRSLAERDDAATAAWTAPGVSAVENHLVVRS